MTTPRDPIHQFLPGFMTADAVGNQARRIRDLLRASGRPSQVYAQFRDTAMPDRGRFYRSYRPGPRDVLLYHHSIGSPIGEFVRAQPRPFILYYHNVTPPGVWAAYNASLAHLMEQGRLELARLKQAEPRLVLAASDYNRQELLANGFERVEVAPYLVHYEALAASAASPAGLAVQRRLRDGKTNWLFVGRIAPNKRQDNLIRAFNYYQKLINPASRLVLVGSAHNAPGYLTEIEVLAESLNVKDVLFTGGVSLDNGLGGYYAAADVFVCLSEHEGFCVPLLEAMRFDVPVVALAATGVPHVVGGAGILLDTCRPDAVGEAVDLALTDSGLRDKLVASGRKRVQFFDPASTAQHLLRILDTLAF